MITIYSEDHRLRAAKTELSDGQLVTPFECPERMDMILDSLKSRGFGDIRPPKAHGLGPAARVHDAGYLRFLETVWTEWEAGGRAGEAMAYTWPMRRMTDRPPEAIEGRIGYYSLSADTAISAGTWEAAQASADVALTAGALVADGAPAAFALCRPPGHHAARDLFGGYCFLNNAAIAAQAARDAGAECVAILDVDFHHGNGTQDIFYDRGDVFFASLHGNPRDTFPYFLGYADETGAGAGEGTNLNLPMSPGTPWVEWSAALETALAAIDTFGPDLLVVSFGADTFEDDPISFFKLTSDDYTRLGARLAAARRPTLIVMEGGYAVGDLGTNTVNLLEGFDAGS
ncbi:histone deacetylase family protein [Ovoidimarina sediminis]|uniref:histone deacetylase family protein n=1 Tax=Ovoidimarina sediminis TaxID=3079856 RepID=UPI00290F31EB|nr:histone deacetylase family protein [Rhodophyticola sp. MJ-SS7]MDU8942870.1 histone deacetylase family protein [Rhodophyticola sp. MJ-SS7]